MKKLMVNIDHVATLRQARGAFYPEPIYAAGIAELAGASGIIVHLREDRRHIKDRDLRLLRDVVKTRLNLEMAATDEMVSIAREVLPDMVTLVPEKRQELTTEGGLDVIGNSKRLNKAILELKEKGIRISLFVDPEDAQIAEAKQIGADIIEIHTGIYSDAKDEMARQEELKKVINSAKRAKTLGLDVNAGHGLNYHNVHEIAMIDDIDELSIGYSIIARAIFVGLERAVKEMLAIMG